MKNIVQKTIKILVLAIVGTGCTNSNWQTALQDGSNNSPQSTKLIITQGSLAGEYETVEQIIARAEDIGIQQCVVVNDCTIWEGFDPCMVITEPTFDVSSSAICAAIPPTTTSTTTTPPFSGGLNIPPGALFAGHYNNISELLAVAQASGFNTCIDVNSCNVKKGFGPCYQIVDPNYNVLLDPACQPSTAPPPQSPPTIPPPTPPPPAGGGFCNSYSRLISRSVSWGDYSRFTTAPAGGFAPDTVMVIQMAIPLAPTSYSAIGYTSACEYQGPPIDRHFTISTQPCDFRPADPSGINGPLFEAGGLTPIIYWNVGIGSGQLKPGQTYYINLKSTNCNQASCDAAVSTIWPHN